jgi:putative membrane protein
VKTLLFACLGMLSFGAAAVAAESAAITDAQIAAIVVTANQVDIDAGKLACETFAVVPGQER